MKKILYFLKSKNLENELKEVIKRFPISIVIIFVVAILFFSLVHGDFTNLTEEKILRVILPLIITFFTSVGLYLSSEGIENKKINKSILQIAALGFGFLFYLGFDNYIDNFKNITYFILTLSGLISYLFFAPYINKLFKNNKQNVFYTYFYNVSIVFLISIILGIVLFILGNIGIIAIFELFDIGLWSLTEKMIGDWAVVSLVIIAPIFALTKLPDKKSFLDKHFNENIFFSFLVKYIAVPFIYIYFIILYAYSIKVLVNFSDWPKGEVSRMVIGFSVFGYITYAYSYIFEEKNKFISFFRKIFPYAVVPQTLMLFYAIYLRISQYDVTMNRYFVIVFGIWLLIISIYYIFSRKKYLSTMFSILTVFIIIISVGPRSVYNLPEERQYKVLISNLEKANILKDGKIIPLENHNDIDNQLSKSIYSGIQYLCNFSNCKSIKDLFSEQYKELLEKDRQKFEEMKIKDKKSYEDNEELKKEIDERLYNEPSKWEVIDHITSNIKVSYYIPNNNNMPTIYLNLKDYADVFPIDANGYNKIIRILNYGPNTSKLHAKMDISNKKIEIIMGSQTIESIDITGMINSIMDSYKKNKKTSLSREEMTYNLGEYKIILENITIDNPDYDGATKKKVYNSTGYLLTK